MPIESHGHQIRSLPRPPISCASSPIIFIYSVTHTLVSIAGAMPGVIVLIALNL